MRLFFYQVNNNTNKVAGDGLTIKNKRVIYGVNSGAVSRLYINYLKASLKLSKVQKWDSAK